MLQLDLRVAKRLLFLGAHSDDIEIGCGATVLKLRMARPELDVLWVVFSAEGKRQQEARMSARLFLGKNHRTKVVLKRFRESYFPGERDQIKSYCESLKSFEPEVVFTHYREDRHQDHRLLSDLTWNTFRNHLILEYEVPKYDGDMGQPNFFIPLNAALAREKARYLCETFQSQKERHWFAEETFLGLMRLRGVACASEYAEAFYCRKIVCG